MSAAPFLATARIAWRDARRNPARTALVVALIAVPVAALVTALVVFATIDPTGEERATAAMGRADLALYAAEDPGILDEATGRFPPGARVERVQRSGMTLSALGARLQVEALGADLDGLAAGMLDVVEGRAPRAGPVPAEVALDRATLDVLGASVGSTVRAEELGEVVVVGIVRDPLALDHAVVVAAPAVLSDAPTEVLVDLPDGSRADGVASDVRALDVFATTRREASPMDADETAGLFVLAGLAFVEVGLVAGAAFAVSTRRRQRELGLLAASGGDAGHLRSAVVLSGAVLGVIGAGSGVTVGLSAAVLARPSLQSWSNQLVEDVVVPPGPVVGAALFGMGVAVVAAWVPAQTSAHLPVLVALSGRRPPTRPSRGWLAIGACLAVVGVLVVTALPRALGSGDGTSVGVALLVGSVLVVLGFGAASPWVLDQLGRLAPHLPLGSRLAVRDGARFRTRNGPVVAAVLAGLAASVAISATVATVSEVERRQYQPFLANDQLFVSGTGAAALVARVGDELPVAAAAPLASAYLTGPEGAGPEGSDLWVTVGDAQLVRAIGGGEEAVAALDGGDILVLDGAGQRQLPPAVPTGTGQSIHRLRLAAVATPISRIVVSEATLGRLGGEVAVAPLGEGWLVRLTGPVSDEELDTARGLASTSPNTFVSVETGPETGTMAGIGRAGLILSVVTALVIVAVALALAAAESRADQQTLRAVGADPRLGRTLTAWRAVLLAGLAAVLAVPAGLVPAWGLVRATVTGSDLFVVPWTTLAVTTFGVPAIAALGGWVLTRASPRRLGA